MSVDIDVFANIKKEIPDLQLINRTAEIDVFSILLKDIPYGDENKRILEWSGVPGVGKSSLVQLFIRHCEEYKIPYGHIDFKRAYDKDTYFYNPVVFLEKILENSTFSKNETFISFRESAETWAHNLKKNKEISDGPIKSYYRLTNDQKLYDSIPWLEELRSVVRLFVKNVAQFCEQNGKLLVLFLDETDTVDAQFSDWIEEWVCAPLVQQNSVVFVWTGRSPRRWQDPIIRERFLQRNRLQGFSIQDAEKHFSDSSGISIKYLSQDLFKNVNVLTNRHPFAVSVIALQTKEIAEKSNLTLEIFSENRALFTEGIHNIFVEGHALEGFDEELKMACELIGLLRRFDLKIWVKVLSDNGGTLYKDWSTAQYNKLLNSLRYSQLLTWDSGFKVIDDLRYLIKSFYKEHHYEKYSQTIQSAISAYQEKQDRLSGNQELNILEELYLQAHLSKQVDLSVLLDERLTALIQKMRGDDFIEMSLMEFEAYLNMDENLKQLVGKDIFNNLQHVVTKKIQAHKQKEKK